MSRAILSPFRALWSSADVDSSGDEGTAGSDPPPFMQDLRWSGPLHPSLSHRRDSSDLENPTAASPGGTRPQIALSRGVSAHWERAASASPSFARALVFRKKRAPYR